MKSHKDKQLVVKENWDTAEHRAVNGGTEIVRQVSPRLPRCYTYRRKVVIPIIDRSESDRNSVHCGGDQENGGSGTPRARVQGQEA